MKKLLKFLRENADWKQEERLDVDKISVCELFNLTVSITTLYVLEKIAMLLLFGCLVAILLVFYAGLLVSPVFMIGGYFGLFENATVELLVLLSTWCVISSLTTILSVLVYTHSWGYQSSYFNVNYSKKYSYSWLYKLVFKPKQNEINVNVVYVVYAKKEPSKLNEFISKLYLSWKDKVCYSIDISKY